MKKQINEIRRMRQLAGIINEIKVTTPLDKKEEIFSYIEDILKNPGYEVTDMKSLKDEIEYSDLVDAVAEKIEGSAIGAASEDSYSKAYEALLQYGKEKFGSMKESQVNEEQHAEPIVMIQNIVDNYYDGGIGAEPAMSRIDKILQGNYEDESGEGYEDEGYEF